MLFFLPLVGFFISLLVLGMLQLDSNTLVAIFGAVFYMVLYGFLHTEAIIDVVDAIFASHSNKNPYEIIKEPTVGAMGVLFGVSFLILKISTLVYLFTAGKAIFLIAVAVGSRVGALGVIKFFEFKSSFLEILQSAFSLTALKVAVVFYSILLTLIIGFSSLAIVLISIVVSLIIAKIIKKRLGFANGDVVGTTIELVELLLIVLVIAYF